MTRKDNPYLVSVHLPRVAYRGVYYSPLPFAEGRLTAARLDDLRLSFAQRKSNTANIVRKQEQSGIGCVGIRAVERVGPLDCFGEVPCQNLL